ncbi:MAG: alpha-glucan family phosphorylase [Phycisphaeraceae bacterium]|nr:alpha-glucan family phosphorylase [Phycisphaeraceae bacterium]
MSESARVAYFSMEVGVDPLVPTYSGGLGILAGDLLRSAADLALPVVGITLLHRAGYFDQSIDATGMQREAPVRWNPADRLELQQPRVVVKLNGRKVTVQAWKYTVKPTHAKGGEVPVYFLDTDVPDNEPEDRQITDALYGGDHRHRLTQEGLLGIAGIYMLRALGCSNLQTYHMNEGHGALVTVELLAEYSFKRRSSPADPEVVAAARRACAFTTHTPVAAGHDQFPLDMVFEVLGEQSAIHEGMPYVQNHQLNMTRLALFYSGFTSAVARRHAEVSREMFPGAQIDYITNGIHAPTWASPEIQSVLDRQCPNWRADFREIRRALFAPDDGIASAHAAAKRRLLDLVRKQTGVSMKEDVFTIGFARRATAYKRGDLLVSDPDRLRAIASHAGAIQIIYAGKAHPKDFQGKEIIQRIIERLRALAPGIQGVFLQNYDMTLAKSLVAGVDLWLNNPVLPLEASGTSGMKAALNGVPSLSTADGWWLEGCVEGVTGWTIGRDSFEVNAASHAPTPPEEDAASLYKHLEKDILPMYYHDRPMWLQVMRHSIALNGSQFNSNRPMAEYAELAYHLPRA